MSGRSRVASALLALALFVGLAGCGSGRPGSSPTPVAPVPVATPTPDMEALYVEAERVLRRWAELEDGWFLAGDYSQYPPELYDVLADPLLSLDISMFEDYQASGWRGLPGAEAPLTVQPASGREPDGSEVALRVCQDSANSPIVDASGEVVSEGGITVMVHYFRHVDGVLKMHDSNSFEVVEECPFG